MLKNKMRFLGFNGEERFNTRIFSNKCDTEMRIRAKESAVELLDKILTTECFTPTLQGMFSFLHSSQP